VIWRSNFAWTVSSSIPPTVRSPEFESGAFEVLERVHHLEQRVPPTGALRIHHVDDPLERHIRVRERREVALADLGEQVGERERGIHLCAENERVDEHADHVVELGAAPPRDRRADGHIVGIGHAREQYRQGTVHHHEGRHTTCVGQGGDPTTQYRVDGDRGRCPSIRHFGRAWAIGRKLDLVR